MSGNKKGGEKAAKTNISKYGKNFYRIIGSKGGQNGHLGGFATNPELAREAGRKGGRISRRTGKSTGDRKEKEYIWKGGQNEALVFKEK